MEILDYKRLVESFSTSKVKTFCQIDIKNQEVITVLHAIDSVGQVTVYKRHEHDIKEIESMLIIDAMYMIKHLINDVDSLRN